MNTQHLFRHYLWLIETIDRAGRISFDEINRLWLENELSGGDPIPRSTFQHHRTAIEEMFGIIIECDIHDSYKYYIGNPEDLCSTSIQHWLVNTMAASAMVAKRLSLKNQILVEDIPSGWLFLDPVLDAITQKRCIMLTYQKFSDSEPYSAVMEPYCVKLFHQRWYVVARKLDSTRPGPSVYALDRVKSVEILFDRPYTLPADFDGALFFESYFGVLADSEAKPQRIVLRTYNQEAKYLQTLPLHHSQKELATVTNGEETYTDFEYYMAATNDFLREIVKLTDWVEVIEPLSLRNDVIRHLQSALSRYQK